MATEHALSDDLISDIYYRHRIVEAGSTTICYLEFARELLALAASSAATELEEMRARKDAAYEERNRVVAALASAYPSGIARTAIEGWSEDWHGCVYIDLPTGQASWHYHDSQAHLFAHLSPYAGTWDGHTTPEKYDRLTKLAAQAQGGA